VREGSGRRALRGFREGLTKIYDSNLYPVLSIAGRYKSHFHGVVSAVGSVSAEREVVFAEEECAVGPGVSLASRRLFLGRYPGIQHSSRFFFCCCVSLCVFLHPPRPFFWVVVVVGVGVGGLLFSIK